MKRKSLLLAITGVAVAIIIAVAINTHLKLSALEPEGHGDESTEEVLQEILTGKPAHSENNEEERHTEKVELSHSD